jgi:hypothetical protein
MKSKVAGIASAAAVVVAILSVALGSTFARAGKQDSSTPRLLPANSRRSQQR